MSLTVVVEKTGGTGRVVIRGRHDRIVHRSVDGVAVEASAGSGGHGDDVPDDHDLALQLPGPTEILALTDGLTPDDLALMARGIATNRAIAEVGLARGSGNGYGRALMERIGGDWVGRVKAWVAAGIEARMAGTAMPVMTSGGSGNSGITVFLGPAIAAESLGIDAPRRVGRACALANLFNIAVKVRIGRVGPLCGGTISSALGVGCAVADLLGAGSDGLDRLVRYMMLAVGGTLCDGAKPGCAFKVATALSAALEAAPLAASGRLDVGSDGLAGASAEGTFDRLARLVDRAYGETDAVITDLIAESNPGLPPRV